MILDRLDNWPLYFSATSPVGRGMQYLSREFDPELPDGRVDIVGDNIFALIQSYDTRPPEKCRFEAHRLYLDIQYVYGGAEAMGWAPRHNLVITEPYLEERDVEFYETPKQYSTLEVYPGSFALFYPGDAHQPCLRIPGDDTVRKVVIKVRL